MKIRSDDEIVSRYLRDGKLTTIPSKLSRKLVVLRWLSEMFLEGNRYDEKEVNEILGRVHPDFTTLRRDLCDYSFMERRDGIYWKAQKSVV
jgi:hypothetical protein